MSKDQQSEDKINRFLKEMRVNPIANEWTSDKFEFTSGDYMFFRTWNAKNPKALVVGVHGMAAHSEYFIQVADQLIEQGISLIAVDLKHHGYSSGKKGDVENFEELNDQLHLFLSNVKEQYPNLPVFLMGISMGGVIAINYSVQHLDMIKGMILMAPGVKTSLKLTFSDIIKLPLLILAFLFKKGKPVINIDKRSDRATRNPIRLKYQDADTLRIKIVSTRYLIGLVKWKKKALKNAKNISTPTIIFIGTQDKLVSYEGTKDYFSTLSVEDKTLVELEGAYHSLFSDPAMVEQGGWKRLSDWIIQRAS